ncbi:unnamed protein product [Effrenium voratum]|nr:unnamed protein product [Effrenium voratum]
MRKAFSKPQHKPCGSAGAVNSAALPRGTCQCGTLQVDKLAVMSLRARCEKEAVKRSVACCSRVRSLAMRHPQIVEAEELVAQVTFGGLQFGHDEDQGRGFRQDQIT